MNFIALSGKEWEVIERGGQVYCYRLDLGDGKRLDIVGDRSGTGDASYDSGRYSLFYIRNGESWRVKNESDLYECIAAGNDIADGELDDNTIINYCYDQIFKKKEETKSSKDPESVDESDSEESNNTPYFVDLINRFIENSVDMSIDVDALKKSIEANGYTSKSIIAMEELAELSQVVSKAHRYIDSNEVKVNSDRDLNAADILDNMAEEIADVLICITNLKIMYGIKNEDIKSWIDYKIRRQKIKDRKMKNK